MSDCQHYAVYRGHKVKMAAGVSWRTPDADPVIDVRICTMCGAWMALDDSVETEAVKVEIRAYEIAFYDDIDDTLTDRERMGFIEGWEDRDDYLRYYTTEDWAGWLAGHIHKHRVETAEPLDIITLIRKVS